MDFNPKGLACVNQNRFFSINKFFHIKAGANSYPGCQPENEKIWTWRGGICLLPSTFLVFIVTCTEHLLVPLLFVGHVSYVIPVNLWIISIMPFSRWQSQDLESDLYQVALSSSIGLIKETSWYQGRLPLKQVQRNSPLTPTGRSSGPLKEDWRKYGIGGYVGGTIHFGPGHY